MITIDGKVYPTIEDAARKLGNVSTKTVRAYISNKIIPRPPEVEWGLRRISIFPPEYIEDAKTAIKRHQEKRQSKRPKKRT